MTTFTSTKPSKERYKWSIYVLINILFLVLLQYSDWHFLLKILFSIPLGINLFFDLFYLKKYWKVIVKVKFTDSQIVLIDSNKQEEHISFKELQYSIRKRKFEKEATEIELKSKGNFRSKTLHRLSFKNWENIFEIENQLELQKIPRVEWKAKTLWGKYWGLFIDLISFSTIGDIPNTTGYQEKTTKENTLNPIKKEKP